MDFFKLWSAEAQGCLGLGTGGVGDLQRLGTLWEPNTVPCAGRWEPLGMCTGIPVLLQVRSVLGCVMLEHSPRLRGAEAALSLSPSPLLLLSVSGSSC